MGVTLKPVGRLLKDIRRYLELRLGVPSFLWGHFFIEFRESPRDCYRGLSQDPLTKGCEQLCHEEFDPGSG